eukprot:SAG11_NODE_12768_length_686_cov_0.879046_1_plen_105_part_00
MSSGAAHPWPWAHRGPALALALLITAAVLPSVFGSQRVHAYGPPDLQEVCVAGICHRFGKIGAPLDHADPSQGEWELTYFVNSDYWDPAGDKEYKQSQPATAMH